MKEEKQMSNAAAIACVLGFILLGLVMSAIAFGGGGGSRPSDSPTHRHDF